MQCSILYLMTIKWCIFLRLFVYGWCKCGVTGVLTTFLPVLYNNKHIFSNLISYYFVDLICKGCSSFLLCDACFRLISSFDFFQGSRCITSHNKVPYLSWNVSDIFKTPLNHSRLSSQFKFLALILITTFGLRSRLQSLQKQFFHLCCKNLLWSMNTCYIGPTMPIVVYVMVTFCETPEFLFTRPVACKSFAT